MTVKRQSGVLGRLRCRIAAGPFDARVLLAFFAIYVVWGTTFLAIRIAVQEVPPLLAAGIRFFTAGILLFTFMKLRGTRWPTPVEWRNLAIIGTVMFVTVYGPLFWAEKYVTSGAASVFEATLPLITMVFEMLVFRHQPFRWRMLGSSLLGFAGVAVLLLHGDSSAPLVPSLAILAGATSWSLGSVLNRSLALPESKPLTAGGAMMFGGGILLALSAAFGEFQPLPHIGTRSWLALAYLVVLGSLVGFTAFVWLLARMPATRVASHAYVNPIVAVVLGYFVAGEVVTVRMAVGAALVLFSVFLILRGGGSAPAPANTHGAMPGSAAAEPRCADPLPQQSN